MIIGDDDKLAAEIGEAAERLIGCVAWRPTSYRLAGGHNQSAFTHSSYDLKCEATSEMFVDEELLANSDYLVRPWYSSILTRSVLDCMQLLMCVSTNSCWPTPITWCCAPVAPYPCHGVITRVPSYFGTGYPQGAAGQCQLPGRPQTAFTASIAPEGVPHIA